MGRNPLKTAICGYLEANRAYLAETTLQERTRKLRGFEERYARICADAPELKRDPAKWSEKEMTAIMLEIRGHGWSPTTQCRELENIQGVLRFVGNGILDRMKAKYPHLFPKRTARRGPSLAKDDREKIVDAAAGMKGWNGEIARVLIWTHMMTGLRPRELRLAEFEDLNVSEWTIRVRHPKGEGSYGLFREVPIPRPLRPVLSGYLKAREQMLAQHGLLQAKPLLSRKDNPNAFYSANTLRRVKAKVEDLSGVRFELRALRRTYGQMLLDSGTSIETASIALGHRSIKTTQAYYCQKSLDTVNSEVLRALDDAVHGYPGAKNPLISRTDDFTGYA